MSLSQDQEYFLTKGSKVSTHMRAAAPILDVGATVNAAGINWIEKCMTQIKEKD